MKKILFLLIMLIAPMAPVVAQEKDDVYMVADVMPRFEKGDLHQWITTHIVKPQNLTTHGFVMVKFVIANDGTVGRIKVTKSLTADADSAVVNVIRALPRFTPARNGDKAVSVWYTERIRF